MATRSKKSKSPPNWMALSPKAEEMNRLLLSGRRGKIRRLLTMLLTDSEIRAWQSYANIVSIRRLGFNDHGTVHMRIATHSALRILDLLREGSVDPSLVTEQVGTFEDSQVAVALGCFLHDLGMGVTRESHEWHSCTFADELIVKCLGRLYPKDDPRRSALRAMCHEIIVGHMGLERIHSVEAGVVLVADGSDMTHGRSRIPQLLSGDPMVGDIHRHSASAIEEVTISAGDPKPVKIEIQMKDNTGIFQVEQVFMAKVKASPIISHLEVAVRVGEEPARHYLR